MTTSSSAALMSTLFVAESTASECSKFNCSTPVDDDEHDFSLAEFEENEKRAADESSPSIEALVCQLREYFGAEAVKI